LTDRFLFRSREMLFRMRSWMFGSTVLNAILLAPAFLGQQDPLAQLYEEARQAEAAGDQQKSVQKYEEIIKLRPDLAEAHSNLGILYYHQNQTAKARQAFKKALELKPTLSAPHFFLGLLAFNARDYASSLRHLKQAEVSDKTNPLVPLYLGYAFYAMGDYEAGSRYLERVTQIEENNADAYYHLSQSYGQLAKSSFAGLQKEFPSSFHTNLAKAHVYETERKWDDAKNAYKRAFQERPGKPLRQKLDWVEQNLKGSFSIYHPQERDDLIEGSTRYLYSPPQGQKIQEALALHRKQVLELRKRQSLSAERLYLLAEGYQVLSYLSSLWVFQRDPDSYRAHQLKGEYHESINQDSEAIEAYRRALKLKPDLQNVHFAIGNLYWKRSNLDEALPELMKELELQPAHPQALYEIGDTLIAQFKEDEAEKYLLRCLKSQPNMVEALLALERIYNMKGSHDKSLAILQKVTELAPKDPTPHYRMSAIYRKQGKLQLAQASMDRFERLRASQSAR
jgi:tetratricopeptide (TPR) repeat protein